MGRCRRGAPRWHIIRVGHAKQVKQATVEFLELHLQGLFGLIGSAIGIAPLPQLRSAHGRSSGLATPFDTLLCAGHNPIGLGRGGGQCDLFLALQRRLVANRDGERGRGWGEG